MYFVSVTRLRLRSWIYLLAFMRSNEASVKQLLITPGFVTGKELIDKNLTFWTITVWNGDADMKTFRNSIPHRKAMQKLPLWCNEAAYMHWSTNDAAVPAWDDVYQKLIAEGKLSKVRYPSANQLDKSYPAVKWSKLQRSFAPLPLP